MAVDPELLAILVCPKTKGPLELVPLREDVRRRLVEKYREFKTVASEIGQAQDLVKSGVIDPAKVTRSALQNAASIAKNILVTEAVIAEPPEKEGAGGGMPGGMPDMGGMM